MDIYFSVNWNAFEILPAATIYRLPEGVIFELSWLQFSLSFDTIKNKNDNENENE